MRMHFSDLMVSAGPCGCAFCGEKRQPGNHFCDTCTSRILAGQTPLICTLCVLAQPKHLRSIAVTWHKDVGIEGAGCETALVLVDDCIACRKTAPTCLEIDGETGVAQYA